MTYIEDLAAVIHQACLQDFEDIVYDIPPHLQNKRVPKESHRRPKTYDITFLEMWQQMWGSTALGFGGIGGAAMTTANVFVLGHKYSNARLVYFGPNFAYKILNPNEQFTQDVLNRHMVDVCSAKKRYEKV